MTKKEYCMTNPPIAYYSGLSGLEIHGIEYSIEDYLYCVSGTWGSDKSYHKLKIHVDNNGSFFVRLHGRKVPMDECIRVGV